MKIEELNYTVVKPVQFHGHVIRKLSDWCNVVPDISIDAELPSLDIQLGPGDYSAILSLMNSLSDGRPTTPPADKGEGGSVEDRSRESEEPSDMRDDTSRDYVNLLLKFQIKEVDLNTTDCNCTNPLLYFCLGCPPFE